MRGARGMGMNATTAALAGKRGEEREGGSAPRHSRRLSDKVLIAFHHACDQGDFDVAEQLLHVLEMMVRRRAISPDINRRRSMDTLVAAHERLWYLRHPEAVQK
jgi:hypothetical protein